jgi:hypothetical protein
MAAAWPPSTALARALLLLFARTPSHALRAALLAALLGTAAGRSAAQVAPPVRVTVAECTEQTVVDLAEAMAIAKSELSPRELQLVPLELSARAGDVLRLEVCQTVRLRWQDSAGNLRLRELALAELPGPTRARTLALAFSELAGELSTAPDDAALDRIADAAFKAQSPAQPERGETSGSAREPRNDDLPLSTPELETSGPPPAKLRVELASELRVMGPPSTALYGPRLTIIIGRYLFGANALFTEHTTGVGSFRMGEALASFGYEIYKPHPALALVALSELGTSWVLSRGSESAVGRSTLQVAGAALAGARARVPIGSSPLYGNIVVLAGYGVGIRASSLGQQAASTDGACVAITLGLGLRR